MVKHRNEMDLDDFKKKMPKKSFKKSLKCSKNPETIARYIKYKNIPFTADWPLTLM